MMDSLVAPWGGNGGTSWDDGTHHGVREITTFSSLYNPYEHIFEDRSKKVKKFIEVGLWRGYGGTSCNCDCDCDCDRDCDCDHGTYHGVREITLKENRSEQWGGNGGTSCDDGTYHGMRKIGPWGGNGGTSWDDGTYHGVRKITLVFGHCINSICVVYDKNGMPVEAEKHGGVGGNQTAEIKLQSPDEYLVGISGYYSPMVCGGSPVIRSLAFKSNKRRFGPFGMEHGTPFSSPMDGGWIVGFMGRSSHHLDAIGFHASRAKPPNELRRTISFPNRRWLDSHIQGTKLAAPRYYRDPCVCTKRVQAAPPFPNL